jgi:hypothetical protein
VCNEAAKILYDENKFIATYHKHPWDSGLSLRVDDPKTANTTARSLRSGQKVSMVRYRGLMYPGVLQRLRHIEFRVALFDRSQMCNHITLHFARAILNQLLPLSGIIQQRVAIPKKNIGHGRDWKIVISSPGMLGYRVMKKILEPVIYGSAPRGARDEKLQILLEGKFPNGWEGMFNRFLEGDSLVTTSVESVDAKKYDVNGMDIEDYFEYGDEIWW